jgi:hypothetical protein
VTRGDVIVEVESGRRWSASIWAGPWKVLWKSRKNPHAKPKARVKRGKNKTDDNPSSVLFF